MIAKTSTSSVLPTERRFSPAMTSVQTTKLVAHPWSDLFNLVLDVKSYPQFVPHCRDVRLLSRKTREPGMTVIVSRMTVGFSAFEVGYSNRTTGDASGRKISIDAVDGPLRYLSALWRFEPQDEDPHAGAFFGDLRIQQSGVGGGRLPRLCRDVR